MLERNARRGDALTRSDRLRGSISIRKGFYRITQYITPSKREPRNQLVPSSFSLFPDITIKTGSKGAVRSKVCISLLVCSNRLTCIDYRNRRAISHPRTQSMDFSLGYFDVIVQNAQRLVEEEQKPGFKSTDCDFSTILPCIYCRNSIEGKKLSCSACKAPIYCSKTVFRLSSVIPNSLFIGISERAILVHEL